MTKTKMQHTLAVKLANKQATIGVVGMGYVGLSLLEVFGKEGFKIVGYDCDCEKVKKLKQGCSTMSFMPLDHLWPLMHQGCFIPSDCPSILNQADVVVICVPTTLGEHGEPCLEPLRSTFDVVAGCLQKDQLIILQSTTYPGTTMEELLPALEKTGKCVGKDFFLGYVPEISDIGNPDYSFTAVPRIVSGVTPCCLTFVEQLYQQAGCKTVPVSCTQVAEAAKVYQNTYRLINIAWVNEMKMLFDQMGLDVWEVIDAAATKPFGFTRFNPGPGIGGDCIPVDPFYLTWKAKECGAPTGMIQMAGCVNDKTPDFVVSKVVEGLNECGRALKGAKVLVLGLGFKKDVDDLRHSASLKILRALCRKQAYVCYHDPYISKISNPNMCSIDLQYKKLKEYDAVVIATDHSSYDWKQIVENSCLVVDTHRVAAGLGGYVIQA